ncbi:hypothetical protein [Chryseobacterium daecheongense]|uniref:TMF family protein n=1 Tax=Chryseobacterium daecheongense TaxID=192389 RepID=A0A3N0VY61_9FLAO|nr:hypothetical protein [Chryseobacterium daecheongense]ROH97743.1 hypothetical protein EGI05_10240 [Chryseobacterium daecheongense]TDX93096.1 hypothetical protein BCF50_2048 [Chryseobacterium daecheongense]
MKKIILLLGAVSALGANAQSWNLTGNLGTNPGTDFIGTTDNQPLVFKTNNTEKVKITPNGRFIFFNVTTPGQIWDKNLFFGGGYDNPTGFYNTAFGMGSLTQNASGNGNTALGNNTMSLITSGDNNVAIGQNSMRNTQSGSFNTGVGMNALEHFQTGVGNVGLGNSAMGSGGLTGDYNLAVGTSALRYINNGNFNVIVGADSFRAVVSGSNNINVGYSNARYITSGSNNIFIGSNIVPYTTSPNNELNIGNWIIGNNGTIGIGAFINPLPSDGIASDGNKYKLFVKDGIKTEKVKVDVSSANGWADYVFEKDYKLMPLKDLEKYIKGNGHLPEVPTTEEAIKNGIELKEMNILLLKKVEELTLYVIEQQKRIDALESKGQN